MKPSLSVVLPLYRTRAQVPELVQRLVGTLAGEAAVELVFVDDACPERSFELVPTVVAGASVVLVRHERNLGQHAAVLSGLARADGNLVAVMDADLQDAPEDVPTLVERIRRDGCDAVAAGRTGRYESPVREMTARLYRRAVHRLSGRTVPADAGMFMVLTADLAVRIRSLGDPSVHLIPAAARVGAHIRTVPLQRFPRAGGSSSYGVAGRLGVALRSLAVLTPVYPAVRRVSALRTRRIS